MVVLEEPEPDLRVAAGSWECCYYAPSGAEGGQVLEDHRFTGRDHGSACGPPTFVVMELTVT
jgi:hypothetical protein